VRESGLIVLTLLIGIAGSAAAGPEDLEEIRGYLERGMLRTANLRLDEHLAAVPDSAEGRLLLAEIRLVEEDWDGAEAAAREALGLGEKSAREWLLWGRARFEQGLARMRKGESTDSTRAWFQQAELGFRKARELAPDHPDILWRMGQAREWQGFRGTAEQLYEAQIREHPGHPGGYRRLGELLARRANVAEGGAPAAAALRAKALEVLERGARGRRRGRRARTPPGRRARGQREDRGRPHVVAARDPGRPRIRRGLGPLRGAGPSR
jgi:tetratricopeptide (TPR) repeat protein